jgi:predicted ATPase
MIAWAERDASKGHMITALRSLAISQMITGAPVLAEHSFTKALELSGPHKERTEEQRLALAQRFAAEPEIASRFHYALTVWSLGRVSEGRRLAADALAEARALRHAHTLGHALAHATIFAVVCRDAVQALALGSETIDFALKHDLEMWKGYGAILKAFALALCGQDAESVPEMETGFSYMARTQTGTMVPLHHALHARSLAALGRLDEAERQAEIVRAELRSGSERYFWPECERLIGDYVSLCPGAHGSDIEAAYRRALAGARAQQAKSWELYAALSLASYWAERGERRKAVELLAPLHDGFPDAVDLHAHREAAALLSELN